MVTWQQGARGAADIIAKIVGDPAYLFDHEPAGLAEAVRGLQPPCRPVLDLYFPRTKPPVAVVFARRGQPDACRLEVRDWCLAHRILCTAVFVRESVTNAAFAERLRHEWLMMAIRHGAVEGHTLPGLAVPSECEALELDQQALALLAAEIKDNPNLRGATKCRRLATLRRFVEREWRHETLRARRGAKNAWEPTCTPQSPWVEAEPARE